jgi:glyoxylase-like metal-dependent hydrolase (beta-lactamase superfamily II)
MSYIAIPSGPFETNAYVLACPLTHACVIIDPSPKSAPSIISYIAKNDLHPQEIWLTHSHWDHLADAPFLKEHYKIPIAVHEQDAPNVENPGVDKLPCWITVPKATASHLFTEGEILKVGHLEAQVLCTPGHTPGGVCFYLAKEKLLFSGDTLFKGTMGNISFPTAQPSLMWLSLEKLATLPPDIKVLPGHGPSTTIGSEPWLKKAENYFR